MQGVVRSRAKKEPTALDGGRARENGEWAETKLSFLDYYPPLQSTRPSGRFAESTWICSRGLASTSLLLPVLSLRVGPARSISVTSGSAMRGSSMVPNPKGGSN